MQKFGTIWSDDDKSHCCPCCLGALNQLNLSKLLQDILSKIDNFRLFDNLVTLNIDLPPIIDVFRVASRTAIMKINEKSAPFPNLSELVHRLLSAPLMEKIGIVSTDESLLKVLVNKRDKIYLLDVFKVFNFIDNSD